MKRRVAILFDNFGPYHLARLGAAAKVCELLAVEFGSLSVEYDWKVSEKSELNRVVINTGGSSAALSSREFSRKLSKVLGDFNPDVVFVPGWSTRGALLSLQWCLMHKVPSVVMSETTAWDENRNSIKEFLKGRILSFFSAALVGGSPHRSYLEQLGFSSDKIFLGYDTVDNDYFERESRHVRSRQNDMRKFLKLPRSYFLSSARFVPKKNLHRLLTAYASYRKESEAKLGKQEFQLWDMVLLGDGPLRMEIESLKSKLGIAECLHTPGFKQYEDLPAYYGCAGAFIHASTTEQWGLVVNEAMASCLPVLVSKRCGCSEDLVLNGFNGWTFDPYNTDELIGLMMQISSSEETRLEMGKNSLSMIKAWGPDRFAAGLSMAIDAAIVNPVKTAPILLKILLKLLL